MKVVSKIQLLTPVNINDNGFHLQLYKIEEEKWIENDVAIENVNTDKLLEIAAKEIVSLMPLMKNREGYIFVTTESPGLSVTIGEGNPPKTETIISPKPEHLRRILFIRYDSTGNTRTVYEYRPSMESVVYDGYISLPSNVQYDIILIETSDNTRILLPHELYMPSIKTLSKPARKIRSKRRRRKHSRKKSKRSR
ncbi:MAG: hypothetical protein QXU13_00040 [Desulfurococcaceae archaeon]